MTVMMIKNSNPSDELGEAVIETFDEGFDMGLGRRGTTKHHIMEWRDDHATVEKIMMDGHVDRAMDDARGFAAIARAVRAAHEFDPGADAHDMPRRPIFDDHIRYAFFEPSGELDQRGESLRGEVGFQHGPHQRQL